MEDDVAAALDIVGVPAMVESEVLIVPPSLMFLLTSWCSFYHLECLFDIHYSGAGATAPEDDPPGAAAFHLVVAAIAGLHHTVVVMSCHMPMGEVYLHFLLLFQVIGGQ